MPNGVPMSWLVGQLPPPADVGRRRQGRPLHRRRRPHVPRLQHRRHVDVLRLRPGAAGPRRDRPDGPRQPVPPARPRTRSSSRRLLARPVRPAEVAVHGLGDACEHGGDPRRPRRDRPGQGPHVRRQVPRPLRRGAGRAGRRRPRGAGGAGRAGGHVASGTVLVPFNDLAALARALERRDIAIVLTEPAITNNIGLLLPDPGFHDALRRTDPGRPARCSPSTRRTRRSSGRAGSPPQWGLRAGPASRSASPSPAACRSAPGA